MEKNLIRAYNIRQTGTVLALLSISLLFCVPVHPQENDLESPGAAVAGLIDPGTRDNFRKAYRGSYILGAVDSARRLVPEKMEALYPGKDSAQIKEAVIDYLDRNPGEAKKPVIEVILAGVR
ncbi:MAG: hypothetical protein HQL30_06695 [Candidatus Omnitrophica bacterium]|nr:hypothetical protein [Candidatus Omnitrophota bacterium]